METDQSLSGQNGDWRVVPATAAEYRVKTEGRGRWTIRRERNDNHWFDCLVGCAVAACSVRPCLPPGRALLGF